MGGGGVAAVDDGAAAWLNPAGLGGVRHPALQLGLGTVRPSFREVPPLWWDTNRDGLVNLQDPPLDAPVSVAPATGLQLSLARPLGPKFGVGLSAWVPTERLVRFATVEPELPSYFLWDNRLQRFVAAFGVGGEVLPGFSVGGSLDLLARTRLDVALTLDAVVGPPPEASTDLDEVVREVVVDVHAIEVDVTPALAPVLGLRLDFGRWTDALRGLSLAGTWHGSVGLPVEVQLDLQANVTATDLGTLEDYVTALVAQSQLALVDHYVPPRVTTGLAWRRADTLLLSADLRWTDWRRMVPSVARLESATLASPLVQLGEVQDGNPITLLLRPVWSVRAGAELSFPPWALPGRWQQLRMALRGGFGYEPSPLVDQGDTTALLDADRSLFSLGLGFETQDPTGWLNAPQRLDLFGQYQLLADGAYPRASAVPQAGYPVDGTSFPVGGTVFAAGATWTLAYR
jgi:long-subunit fatty acid transport protein